MKLYDLQDPEKLRQIMDKAGLNPTDFDVTDHAGERDSIISRLKGLGYDNPEYEIGATYYVSRDRKRSQDESGETRIEPRIEQEGGIVAAVKEAFPEITISTLQAENIAYVLAGRVDQHAELRAGMERG